MSPEVREETAKQIYQGALDRIGKAYFDNDFAAFQAEVYVPHHYTTQEGTEHVIANYAQLREAFDCFRDYFIGLGVTDFVRTCTGAMYLSETKIIGGHDTEVLQSGTRIRDPYSVMSIMELIDGVWQVCSSENALPDNSWQVMSFRHGAEKLN
ncbi:hypothetical protein [Yoonia sp. BS5-3]|uniref:SnoaL-like domain-containing protein n=1 Tax=Yoonia phaeophyticola TaxID=3137369 RepID=A0ABZ2UYL7_9RHOB